MLYLARIEFPGGDTCSHQERGEIGGCPALHLILLGQWEPGAGLMRETTVGLNEEEIRRYIREQEEFDQRQDRLEFQ